MVVFLLAICCLLGLYMRKITIPMGFGDSERYLPMAEAPGTFTTAPWGYRIAIPYAAASLSSLLGVSIKSAFGMLQVGMYSILLTTMFLWIHLGLRVDSYTGAITTLLFVFSYAGVYNLHNVVHVGFGEHLLVLLGIIAIYHNYYGALLGIIILSCFVKETVGLIIVPTFFVYSLTYERLGPACLKTAILGIAFVSLSLLVRSSILFTNHTDVMEYVSFFNWQYVKFVYAYWGGVRGAIWQTAQTFGPTWLLAFAGFLVAPTRLKLLAVVPALCTLQIVFATDVLRMVGVGFPVVLALSALSLTRVDVKWRTPLVCLSAFYFLCWNHGIGGKYNMLGSVALTACILMFGGYYDLVRLPCHKVIAKLNRGCRLRREARRT
jgi:hypothetical protein